MLPVTSLFRTARLNWHRDQVLKHGRVLRRFERIAPTERDDTDVAAIDYRQRRLKRHREAIAKLNKEFSLV
jgi:hypothetical protein